MTPERFLVPIDFSPEADRALQVAITLGVPLRAHLVLLHVRDDSELNPWASSGGAEAAIRKLLQECLKPGEAAGLSGEVVLVHGTPWREIIDIAGKRQATLVIMGTHGQTHLTALAGLRHLLLGSVAENVIRHASCPVLVTRCPESIPEVQDHP